MMKRVIYTLVASKFLARLPDDVSLSIQRKMSAYAADPRAVAGSVKRLRGDKNLRLRVGNYRVIFEEETLTVIVIKIGHRSDIYM